MITKHFTLRMCSQSKYSRQQNVGKLNKNSRKPDKKLIEKFSAFEEKFNKFKLFEFHESFMLGKKF